MQAANHSTAKDLVKQGPLEILILSAGDKLLIRFMVMCMLILSATVKNPFYIGHPCLQSTLGDTMTFSSKSLLRSWQLRLIVRILHI